jgi:hypothetical protein
MLAVIRAASPGRLFLPRLARPPWHAAGPIRGAARLSTVPVERKVHV